MGDPRRLRKKYTTPKKPWDKARIVAENEIKTTYGLKTKKEILITKTILDRKRQSARNLLAARPEQMEIGKKTLIDSLTRLGILSADANFDNVLALKVEDFLERRIQTLVFRRGLATTVEQSRQFIVHGHIAIGDKKVSSPGYLVPKNSEELIKYYKGKKPKVLEVILEAPETQKLQKEAATEDTVKESTKEAVEAEKTGQDPREVVK